MVNNEGYDYEKFLSDSSDDCPKYADGVTPNLNKVKADEVTDDSSQCSPYIINQNNDEWKYKEAYQKSSSVVHKGTTENLKIALINVLEMAKDYFADIPSTGCQFMDSDKIIAEESIKIVEEHLGQIEDTNAMLANADKE